jgi:uncharacterized protein YhaN
VSEELKPCFFCGVNHEKTACCSVEKCRQEIDSLRQRVAELEQRLKAAEQRMDAYWRVSMKR